MHPVGCVERRTVFEKIMVEKTEVIDELVGERHIAYRFVFSDKTALLQFFQATGEPATVAHFGVVDNFLTGISALLFCQRLYDS